jgi:hypothetical protein
MTKVLVRYQLQSPLGDSHLARLADLRGFYGILSFEHDANAGILAVEYDATRLRPPEVASLLRRHGLPVVPGSGC